MSWLTDLAADKYQTMWVAIQSVATILAFGAAFWYGLIAKRQMRATEEQLHITNKQLELAEGELEAAKQQSEITARQLQLAEQELAATQLHRQQDNKPIIVLDRRDYPERGNGNYGYVLCNIGRGFALNIYCVPCDSPSWSSLGGLAAGQERPVPEFLAHEISRDTNCRCVLIAEGASTRTRRWNPTMNVMGPGLSFVHALRYPKAENDNKEVAKAEAAQEIDAYLGENRIILLGILKTVSAVRHGSD
jgi:hypothetical protein